MPIVKTIKVSRGEDITINATMTPKKDITGWVISMTVAQAPNDLVKLFQVTATITSGPNGTYSLIITSNQLNIDPGTYYYDIFRVNPGNNRILNYGEFVISADARFP
jgi:hypothetical protein